MLDDPTLTELHATKMTLPYRNGFSPRSWQKVVNIMLEKQLGISWIHRLHIMALMESDFSHANRILFGRQLAFKIEDNNFVSDMQYGSRPGKKCISAILHKLLTYIIAMHKKGTAAFIENDAVGCYDQMVSNILLLCLRRLGIPVTATQSLGETWNQAQHFIPTQYGISEESYCNTSEFLLFGPGQGSTIGPFLWLLCYCLMVDSMTKDIMKFHSESVDKSRHVPTAGTSFVDDTGLGVILPTTSECQLLE